MESNNAYYSRMIGADKALWCTSCNVSKDAYFWNATSQKNRKNVGLNWSSYNKGIFTITSTLGKSTFFKYTNLKKTWP